MFLSVRQNFIDVLTCEITPNHCTSYYDVLSAVIKYVKGVFCCSSIEFFHDFSDLENYD